MPPRPSRSSRCPRRKRATWSRLSRVSRKRSSSSVASRRARSRYTDGSMTSPIITEAMRALVERKDLSRIEAAGAMEAIMSGAATNAQIAAFLTALRMKGETVEELIGFAQVMREKVARVPTRGEETAALTGTDREMLIDTCGTGGDASGTFNISTATAFVVAGAGLKVAKHGNRSASSLCGSADVVETLGVNLELTPAQVGRCIDEAGIGFL